MVTKSVNMSGLISSRPGAARRPPGGAAWVVLGLLALLLAACSSGPEPGVPVVARVNDEVITLAEFNSRAAFMGLGGDPALLDKSLRQAVVRDLIQRHLVLAKAQSLGIELEPDEADRREKAMLSALDQKAFEHNLAIHGISRQDWRAELERQLLMDKALRMILLPQARVSPQEVAEYYQQHRERFDRPEQILAQHVLLPSQELAQKLVDQVKSGQDMSQAAAAMGSPLAEGGRPAWLSRGHMPPALEKKVFALKAGQLAGPLPSTYGFHVVLVQAKRPAAQLTLAQAASRIQKTLSAERREKLAAEYIAKLMSQARVQYEQRFLEQGRAAFPGSG